MDDRADDDLWLDALRGRAQAGTDESTLSEARDLRHALLDSHTRHGATEQSDSKELQRLLFRLRREGLLKGSTGATASYWRFRAPLAAAAAVVLAVAFTLTLQTDWPGGSPDEDVLRGSGSVQTIEVADVPATVQRLGDALREVGAIVAIIDLGNGATEVAATLPTDWAKDIRGEMESMGVKLNKNGALRVVVRPRR